MWVKKTSYKRIQEEREYFRDAYQDMVIQSDNERLECLELNKRIHALLDDVAELKQKYADEVQKRLVLIEQIKKEEEER